MGGRWPIPTVPVDGRRLVEVAPYSGEVSVLPARSPGVLVSAMGDRVIGYDLVGETAHLLNASAGTVLVACDGRTSADDAVARWAQATGTETAEVRSGLESALASLTERGLVGRTTEWVPPSPLRGCRATGHGLAVFETVHSVIDWAVTFRSTRPDALAAVDAHLGTRRMDHSGTPLVIEVEPLPGGQIAVREEIEWTFESLNACIDQLTGLLAGFAPKTTTCAVLHAGAVRSPRGEIVLLPGASGSGKSTLVAAFVGAGWGYLGEDAIGVRPGTRTAVGYPKRLRLDATSRKVLGLPPGDELDCDPRRLNDAAACLSGDVGPVDRIVFAEHVRGHEITMERLDPDATLQALLVNASNLAYAGEPALDAICDLAAEAESLRLVHGDACEVANRADYLLCASPGRY